MNQSSRSQYYDVTLAEAHDPGTQSEHLAVLWRRAFAQYTGFKNSGNSSKYEHPLNTGLPLLQVLAQNPNLPLEILQEALEPCPYEVVRNPIIPLLILEGAWASWNKTLFVRLRVAAYETAQDFYPALTQVCYPHWRNELDDRYYPHKGKVCGHVAHCIACNEQDTQKYLERWRAMRGA